MPNSFRERGFRVFVTKLAGQDVMFASLPENLLLMRDENLRLATAEESEIYWTWETEAAHRRAASIDDSVYRDHNSTWLRFPD
jgi:hypothetical protein